MVNFSILYFKFDRLSTSRQAFRKEHPKASITHTEIEGISSSKFAKVGMRSRMSLCELCPFHGDVL